MALKPNIYSASNSGMTRLRVKGGASGDTLYELTNAFVNADRMPQRRPGTSVSAHLTGAQSGKTHGLVPFAGQLYTFTISPGAALVGPPLSVVVLPYPTATPPGGVDIRQIHFAQAYMGKLYVTAEFTDGVIADYWLQNPAAWMASTIYLDGQLVQPTVPNGLYFRATLQDPPPAWQANKEYSTLDVVQPSTYNGFEYAAISLLPASPSTSGAVEPTWPTTVGALVIDSTSGIGSSQPPEPPETLPPPPPGRESGGRYSNPGGTGGRLGNYVNPPPRTP